MSEVPAYLQAVPESQVEHFYGDLRWDARTDSWIIEGEPCVIQMALRLFPGSEGRRTVARFHANPRTAGDLNWLMLRYPLRVEPGWEESRAEAVRHVLRRQEILRAPAQVDPGPDFKGQLLPYQKEGLAWCIHNERTLLADDMGLGKTVQAIAYLATAQKYPVLIVAPPHLLTHWESHLRQWLKTPAVPGQQLNLFQEAVFHTIRGTKPYPLPPRSIYLCHYLLLRAWREPLLRMGLRTIIFDEIQELRRGESAKYSAASMLAERAEDVIGLSGTPVYNRGGEMWYVVNILSYQCLGDFESFSRQWCMGYGSDIVRDPDLLREHLKREGLLLRRTKDEVMPDLPPKRRVVEKVDLDQGRYAELVQGAVTAAAGLEGIKDQLERGRAMRDIVEETRRATGLAKAPYVAAFVRMLVEAGEPVLLFGHHHDVFDAYGEALADLHPVRISGRETRHEKDEAVRAFMAGETNLCLLSLRSVAGWNLQRATCVVAGELDWSPAVHAQAEDRAYRMGQTQSVMSYFLVAEEGSDPEVLDALGLKVAQFNGLMGEEGETEEAREESRRAEERHMARIVERLRNRRAQ